MQFKIEGKGCESHLAPRKAASVAGLSGAMLGPASSWAGVPSLHKVGTGRQGEAMASVRLEGHVRPALVPEHLWLLKAEGCQAVLQCLLLALAGPLDLALKFFFVFIMVLYIYNLPF